MPAGMHDSHRPKIQPQRQCLEPIRDLPLAGSALHLVQECLVLRPISGLVMISQELAGFCGSGVTQAMALNS